MRTALKVIAALGLALATGQTNACVAQCSVHPPITMQAVHAASGIIAPSWTHAIDPQFNAPPSRRGSANANLAVNAGTFVVVDDGKLIALDSMTGHEQWRTAASHFGIPVIVGDTVVAADGASRAIDAFALHDGKVRWRFDLPAMRHEPSSDSAHAPPERYIPPVVVAAEGDGFLVSTQVDAGQPYQYNLLLTELDVRGVRRWAHVVPYGSAGRVAAIRDGVAYLASVEDGSIITDVVRLVRLGSKGGFLGSLTFAIGPLGWNAAGDPIFENAFSIGNTSFAVESVPLAQFTGDSRLRVGRTTWTYAPDALPGDSGFGEAGVEDGFVYGLIHYARDNGTGRLYRYRLDAPGGQLPVLLGTSITDWVAGPSHGWNIVEDGGELVALRVRDDRREVRLRLDRYDAGSTVDAAAFDGHRLYVARSDGHVQGFDLDAARTILDAPTRCAPDGSIDRQIDWRSIGVHGNQLVAVCARRVYVFTPLQRSRAPF